MSKPKILLQIDSDAQPSVFDSVVAVDAGVEHLLRHGSVAPHDVAPLVHGAIFTRGGDDLRSTAIFVGGSRMAEGETLLAAVKRAFFGPMRVSVMLDSNGANTTAAAATLAVARHVDLAQTRSLVLGATGPVGRRVARLLARAGGEVRVGSRSQERAREVCDDVAAHVDAASLTAVATGSAGEVAAALKGCQVVVAAGAAGVELLSVEQRRACDTLRVAVDLNAVPPTGLAGVDVMDRGRLDGQVACYGAIGVGGTKMKIHKAALRRLFEANDLVLDAEEIFTLAQSMAADL
ncbi:MAG: NAD(P)H-binding protein [Pirellulales bacterium]|nr:NAD(P)H-binding protein [Pirellulales bacterium]